MRIDLMYGFYSVGMDWSFSYLIFEVSHNKYAISLAMLCCGERLSVLIKNVDVCKFSDFDRICILSTTILMDNFGFLKILWIEGRLKF